MAPQCTYIRPGNRRCRRYAQEGSALCPVHQPEPVPDNSLMNMGELNVAFNHNLHPHLRLVTMRDALDVIRESVQALRLGHLEPRQAIALGFLMDRWFKARDKLAFNDRVKNLRTQMLGELADNDFADAEALEAAPPPHPIVTPQSAVNAAAALNPPDLYDPDTGRRLVAPGIPLTPTIEELAFDVTQTLGPQRAAELYPGVIPRPFIPTGDPMPYAALQLLRQARARTTGLQPVALSSSPGSTGYQPVPPASSPRDTGHQPVALSSSPGSTGYQPVPPASSPAVQPVPLAAECSARPVSAPGTLSPLSPSPISSSAPSAQSADSPLPPKMPPRKQTDSTRAQAEVLLRGLKVIASAVKSANASGSARPNGKPAAANDGAAKSSRSP